MSNIILSGQDAIDLWLQGRNAWNQWVTENPVADVSFAGIDFGQFNLPAISFAGFEFPKGNVFFDGANFGEGDVYFSSAIFGEGNVDFRNATFGKGDIDFWRTTFGEGVVDFDGATFGKGNIDFTYVISKNSHFLWENIFLSKNNSLNFANLQIDGPFRFTIDHRCLDYHITEFSLRHATLEGPVDIDARFDCIPDLRGSKTSHHVDLGKLIINPSAYQTLDENEDFAEKASKLCRLKEIAENNKDHGAGLRFHAAERRTIRHSGTLPKISQFIDLSFDKMSHYGQSLERPLIGFVGIFTIFWLLYLIGGKLLKQTSDLSALLSESFSLSISSMLPFLPVSRIVYQDALEELFGNEPEWYIDFLFLTQGALSFLFLFLLGLGLRNRFRL